MTLILDMVFTRIHIRSRIMFWSSDSQVCSAWGQPIGRVEQSHGGILSDGISCGGRANCQADFTVMRREGGKIRQTNRDLAQSPISKQHRRAQREPPRGSQEAEMKRKARSNLFVVARTQFFRAR